MPYTWLIRTPGLSAFREADRFAFPGLLAAAMLAGAAVHWLARRGRWAVVVVAAAWALEAGWPGAPHQPIMPTTLPAVDRPLAASHSGGIVVDVPFGLRGGLLVSGAPISPLALVLATADGHPRAVSYTSWVPPRTTAAMARQAFYASLAAAQRGTRVGRAVLAVARRNLRHLHVGWLLVWGMRWLRLASWHPHVRVAYRSIAGYLAGTGFRRAWQADGVTVYRPEAGGRTYSRTR
jgi:hypothetical protein